MNKKRRKPIDPEPYIGAVERGRPMPVGNRRYKYPFRDLKVGDSFLTQNVPHAKIKSAIASHKKRYPETEFRTSTDPDTGGIRVHRVEFNKQAR